MPEQPVVETQTIVRDGATIIIAHPQPKKETDLWETFSNFFKSETKVTPQNQTTSSAPAQQTPIVVTPVSVSSVPIQSSLETKQAIQEETSPVWKQFVDLFSRQNIAEYRKNLHNTISDLDGIDVRLSNGISKFKQDNILTLGDIRVRSIIMAFSSALLYKIVSCNTNGFFRKTRNLGLSFVFMGYWFAPQLFNPFLSKPSLAHHVV